MELFDDWGGRGYDDSVPGEVTKTVPSGVRTASSPTWSASLSRIQFITPGGWSSMSLVGSILVPSALKTGINLLHPLPPQSLNGSLALSHPWQYERWKIAGRKGLHLVVDTRVAFTNFADLLKALGVGINQEKHFE